MIIRVEIEPFWLNQNLIMKTSRVSIIFSFLIVVLILTIHCYSDETFNWVMVSDCCLNFIDVFQVISWFEQPGSCGRADAIGAQRLGKQIRFLFLSQNLRHSVGARILNMFVIWMERVCSDFEGSIFRLV